MIIFKNKNHLLANSIILCILYICKARMYPENSYRYNAYFAFKAASHIPLAWAEYATWHETREKDNDKSRGRRRRATFNHKRGFSRGQKRRVFSS